MSKTFLPSLFYQLEISWSAPVSDQEPHLGGGAIEQSPADMDAATAKVARSNQDTALPGGGQVGEHLTVAVQKLLQALVHVGAEFVHSESHALARSGKG